MSQRPLDVRQLSYFLAVVDEGGMTRAAAVLHVAQPSLSQSVRSLERELGTDALVHVFPAMPVSLAVAFGSAVTPKVSLPFSIHDAQGPSAPFHPALSLPIRDL